jgi:hypothetical protein
LSAEGGIKKTRRMAGFSGDAVRYGDQAVA